MMLSEALCRRRPLKVVLYFGEVFSSLVPLAPTENLLRKLSVSERKRAECASYVSPAPGPSIVPCRFREKEDEK